jgi:hypothetical protein
MKKFEITYTMKKTFTIPDTATDEEYDATRDTLVGVIKTDGGTDIDIKLVDAPEEIKAKYIINKECQD